MIWSILFMVSLIANILIIIYMPSGPLKEYIILIISLIIGALGFSFKDSITEFKVKRRVQKRYKEVCERFNSYFGNSLKLTVEVPKDLKEEYSENEILDYCIEKNINNIDGNILNSIRLCYYCKKWSDTKSPEDYESIKKIAESIGIKYAEIDANVELFLLIFETLILKQSKLEIPLRKDSKELKNILKLFMRYYYKDLQFFEIREIFYQNKNLHETLIKITKDGKLSIYGITKETIKRLENELSTKVRSSNIFVIFTANTSPEDRKELKDYIHNYSRFGMAGTTTNMPISAKFGVYIIKTEKNKTAKGILKEIKNSVNINSEAIIRIAPLNFVDSETYTLPFNQSFTNSNLKKCHEAIEWFKVGYDYSDAALWSEITRSNITPDELLSIIPFNIFCKGILPCEQEFIIKNYDAIKNNFNVNKLTDWKDKDSILLASSLLKFGVPQYSSDELKIRVNTTEDDAKRDEKIEKRILSLSKQIIDGAKNFDMSLNPKGLGE